MAMASAEDMPLLPAPIVVVLDMPAGALDMRLSDMLEQAVMKTAQAHRRKVLVMEVSFVSAALHPAEWNRRRDGACTRDTERGPARFVGRRAVRT